MSRRTGKAPAPSPLLSPTFDTGALIALEGRRAGISAVVRDARETGTTILVPANVLAEWWRGGSRQWDILASLKPSLKIQDVDERVAKLAGQALEWYGRQTDDRITASLTIDATVLATRTAGQRSQRARLDCST